MDTKLIIFAMACILIGGICGYMVPQISYASGGLSVKEIDNIHGHTCVYIKRAGMSDFIKWECSDNLVVDQGKDYLLELMSGIDQTGAVPGTDFAKYISLTDNATLNSADTVLNQEITTGGLARAEGICSRNGVGNYSCVVIFNATASFTGVNGTGLNWNATPGAATLVAENSFTPVNLISGDSLKINYTIAIV